MKRLLYFVPFLILIIISCDKKSGYNKCEGMVWNTVYHVIYNGPSSFDDSITAVLNKVGKSLSVFDSTSLVTKINAVKEMKADSNFIRVYMMSEKINKMSGGSFDPTLSPLITAWGFGKGHQVNADTARIDSIRKFVGFNLTRLSEDGIVVKEDPRVQFNFSAIAKGYGCDAVGDMFLRNGITDFLVEIGGEIFAAGLNPKGEKWRVSIEKPELDAKLNQGSVGVVEISGAGVATSGNYRNFHESNGRYFGHTIDVKSGRPSTTDVISATVISSSAMEADGLATAIMAMGSSRAKAMIENNNIKAMLILNDSSVWLSPGFKFLETKN